MDGDEKLPKGWTKVQSRSHPDKVYYYNNSLKLSLWKLEDLKKKYHKSNKSSLPETPLKSLPETPAKSHKKAKEATVKKQSGISNQSKNIKKNIARERLGKLQVALADEVKKDNQRFNNGVKKINDVIEVTKPNFKKSSEAQNNGKKNTAANRLKQLNHKLEKEVIESKQNVSASHKEELPKSQKVESVEVPCESQCSNEDVDMMEISFTESSQELEKAFEPMEWEDVPEIEVINKVQQIRSSDIKSNSTSTQKNACRHFKALENGFYIIVDTNVLLSNIDFVKEIKGKHFKGNLITLLFLF